MCRASCCCAEGDKAAGQGRDANGDCATMSGYRQSAALRGPPQMIAGRNQIIERHYFERFRKAYSVPTGQLGYGDKPDVTLTGEREIGIEVTRFYLQPGSCLERKQRPRPRRAHL